VRRGLRQQKERDSSNDRVAHSPNQVKGPATATTAKVALCVR
jgi:hypothetical protein